ncbi:MAG: hypothetical protein J6R33_01615 [Clostridia bacterium]|nr:hypothetical protein [Clostridia bacterium]
MELINYKFKESEAFYRFFPEGKHRFGEAKHRLRSNIVLSAGQPRAMMLPLANDVHRAMQ